MSESFVLKAVVDTNIFVSGVINVRGRPSQLLDAWRAGEFELLLSEQQYDELKDVFSRPKIQLKYQIKPKELDELFSSLDRATRIVASLSIPIVVRDVKDERILATAFSGNADYLVSGDNDLLVLREDPRLGSLQIVTVNQFLALLEEG
jgi:uncharacterized protein